METQTHTPKSGRGNGKAPVGPSNQTEIPGTEKGSPELREKHGEYATHKYLAKWHADQANKMHESVLDQMDAEGIESLSCSVNYGEAVKRCVTEVQEKLTRKLVSKLEDEVQGEAKGEGD
jgi:hypothetical protein